MRYVRRIEHTTSTTLLAANSKSHWLTAAPTHVLESIFLVHGIQWTWDTTKVLSEYLMAVWSIAFANDVRGFALEEIRGW